jgi:hypothetical protein
MILSNALLTRPRTTLSTIVSIPPTHIIFSSLMILMRFSILLVALQMMAWAALPWGHFN